MTSHACSAAGPAAFCELFDKLARRKKFAGRESVPLWTEEDAFRAHGGAEWASLFIDDNLQITDIFEASGPAADADTPWKGHFDARGLLLYDTFFTRCERLTTLLAELLRPGVDDQQRSDASKELDALLCTPLPVRITHLKDCKHCELPSRHHLEVLKKSTNILHEERVDYQSSLGFEYDSDKEIPCATRFQVLPADVTPTSRDAWLPMVIEETPLLTDMDRFEELIPADAPAVAAAPFPLPSWTAGLPEPHSDPLTGDNLCFHVLYVFLPPKQLSSSPESKATPQAEPAADGELCALAAAAAEMASEAESAADNGVGPAEQLVPVCWMLEAILKVPDVPDRLRKMASSDILAGLGALCWDQQLPAARVLVVKRYVALCLGSVKKANQPLATSLAEMDVEDLIPLARYVRDRWRHRSPLMSHSLAALDARACAFTPADDADGALQPSPRLLEWLRQRRAAQPAKRGAEAAHSCTVDQLVEFLYMADDQLQEWGLDSPGALELDKPLFDRSLASLHAVEQLLAKNAATHTQLQTALKDLLCSRLCVRSPIVESLGMDESSEVPWTEPNLLDRLQERFNACPGERDEIVPLLSDLYEKAAIAQREYRRVQLSFLVDEIHESADIGSAAYGDHLSRLNRLRDQLEAEKDAAEAAQSHLRQERSRVRLWPRFSGAAAQPELDLECVSHRAVGTRIII
jgi:hypothetical protein